MLKPPQVKAQPQDIPEAYEELTAQAFSAWIRLACTTPEHYNTRAKLITMLGYSDSTITILIRELAACKYIAKYKTTKSTRATGYLILKKPKISGPRNFVVLNNALVPTFQYGDQYELEEERLRPVKISGRRRNTKSYSQNTALGFISTSSSPNNRNNGDHFVSHKVENRRMPSVTLDFSQDSAAGVGDINSKTLEKPTRGTNHRVGINLLPDEIGCPLSKSKCSNPKRRVGDSRKDAQKSIGLESTFCDENLDPPISFNNINLDLFKKKYNSKKKERKALIKKKVKDNKILNSKNLDSGLGTKTKIQPDWSKLNQDLRGNPQITFSPSKKTRKQYIEIFDKSNRSLEKKELLKKFGSEFARIYSRYRRQLQKQAGKKGNWTLFSKDVKYAQKVAELCIRKNLTPRQILMYWHHHIKDFSERQMQVPPIIFLTSVANIETVACSDLKELETVGASDKLSPGGNSFSDVSKYDVRVRQELEKAGFDVCQYSNMELMSIQFSAKAFARGVDLYVDDDIQPLADHLAKTLYKKLKPCFG